MTAKNIKCHILVASLKHGLCSFAGELEILR